MNVARHERERNRARAVLLENRARSALREGSIAARRLMAARHALQVLASDHRAFMAAVGHGEVTLDVALTSTSSAASQQPSWRSDHKAYTDFAKILVRVPPPALRTPLRKFIVEVRGILHHEAGHVRFTIPLPELWDRAYAAMGPQLRSDVSVGKLQMAWNCLEDQRMEAAVVRATPRMRNYFTPMVLSYVLADTQALGYMSPGQTEAVDRLAPWIALAGRDYVPDDVRTRARDEFDQFGEPFDVASDDWFDIVSRYMSSTDEVDMLTAVFDAHDFLAKLLDDMSPHKDAAAQHLNVMSVTQTKDALTKKITDTNEQHQQMADSPGNDPEDSATAPRQPQPGGGATTTQELLQLAMESADVDELMSRIGARIAAGSISGEDDAHASPMPEHFLAGAMVLSHAMRDALEVFRTEKSPVWVRHQESGYLDAVAYRTREPGARNYRREPQNWGSNGLGVHVSFLADRSGSMHANMAVLSQTLWATKTACDALDIPSTMVLWAESHETSRVMEHDDTPMLYSARGGTEPLAALNDLDSHVTEDGLHHLVFVFTDGEWTKVASLTEWHQHNRTFVIIGLRCDASIANKDADVVIPITSIGQLGAVVKNVLEDHLAMR